MVSSSPPYFLLAFCYWGSWTTRIVLALFILALLPSVFCVGETMVLVWSHGPRFRVALHQGLRVLLDLVPLPVFDNAFRCIAIRSRSPPMGIFIQGTFGHHWVGKGVLAVALFAVATLAMHPMFKKRNINAKTTLVILNTALILGSLILFFFFVYEYFHNYVT